MAYECHEYSLERLFEALSNEWTPVESLREHKAIPCLHRHLLGPSMDVSSFLIEEEYTDGEYLDEFAYYYSKCGRPYSRTCKRLHFFAQGSGMPPLHNPGVFERLFEDSVESRELRDAYRRAYRGFIVARPIQDAVIGRTVLKPWDDETKRRRYVSFASYPVSLFGLRFEIAGLPFQEQNGATSVCATVAVWSCLKQAANIYGSLSPRPIRVTQHAITPDMERRSIPNAGLSLAQVCLATRNAGLDVEVFQLGNEDVTKERRLTVPWLSLIKGYLGIGIPVLLVCQEQGKTDLHALTVCGYGFAKDGKRRHVHEVDLPTTFVSSGLWLNELYAHDDQRGAYCHYFVEHQETGTAKKLPYVSEHGVDVPEGERERRFRVLAVVVPVYEKVRVSYTTVHELLLKMSNALYLITKGNVHFDKAEGSALAHWECALTTTNALKHTILSDSAQDVQYGPLLFENLPHFMWRAQCQLNGGVVLDVIIDATDSPSSSLLWKVLWRDAELLDAFGKFKTGEGRRLLNEILGSATVEWLYRNLS